MSSPRPEVVARPAKFATLAEAEPLVLAGRHQRETLPKEGGRWPITVVLAPDAGPTGWSERGVTRDIW